LTKNQFNNYKLIAEKVIKLLIAEKCSSSYDICVIYNIVRGFPYCLDTEEHYTYQGEYYSCLEDLPIEALQQINIVNQIKQHM